MDIEKTIDAAKTLELPVKELSTNALGKPTTELGEGLANLFWLVFAPIHAARKALEPRINKFGKDIAFEVSKIPQEKLKEPPLEIVGPSLEAAKYHIEHDEIREMFAKLIASSLNSDFEEKVHPSFIEVIKQLSPFDVKILNLLKENSRIWGIGNIHYIIDGNRGILVPNFFPFPDISLDNFRQYSAAVQNLNRLSIINWDFQQIFADSSKYDILFNHVLYQQYVEAIEIRNDTSDKPAFVNLERGMWRFTDFGDLFIECCT
ncbi:DUF4393 domain-containing protein [Cohnella sp. GCM10012308]|uniref:DUF4393 domain-containing protein n=1 Tax=Cohnella sp. GCM10012308 TaxID=3317329 RepID=UPI003607543D